MQVEQANNAEGPGDATPTLGVETRGAVLCLTLEHPQTRNALVPDLSQALIHEFLKASDNGLRAVIVTGAQGRFCSGGDVRALRRQQDLPPASQVQRLGVLNELIRTVRQCPLPVIAAVEGTAAGAGFSLMLACDLVVAAEDARFVMAYVHLGLTPDGGGSFHLVRALPPQQAFAAMALGDPIDAPTLHRAGVLHAVVPRGQALQAAHGLAQRLADGPRESLASIKQLVNAAPLSGLESHLERERELFVRALHGRAARDAIPAFLDRGRHAAADR
jgi:enoyl-CoA hydratase/carnithine racemase